MLPAHHHIPADQSRPQRDGEALMRIKVKNYAVITIYAI
jgi:hypothetical protein